jgi:hypothetical protein
MKGPAEGMVPLRFIGIMSLISSLAASAASMSTYALAIMLAITAVTPLVSPYKTRSRWRVVLGDVVAGLVIVAGVYYARSRGMRLQ